MHSEEGQGCSCIHAGQQQGIVAFHTVTLIHADPDCMLCFLACSVALACSCLPEALIHRHSRGRLELCCATLCGTGTQGHIRYVPHLLLCVCLRRTLCCVLCVQPD